MWIAEALASYHHRDIKLPKDSSQTYGNCSAPVGLFKDSTCRCRHYSGPEPLPGYYV